MGMFNNLKIKYERKTRKPVGTFIYARKSDKYPEGVIGKVISYNTFESEYHVTTVLKSTPSNLNPYILENEETGFKVTKEEFDNGEFVKYKDAVIIDFEPQSMLRSYIVCGLILLGISFLIAKDLV